MTNELMLAATAFFALGAFDYGYRLIRMTYWDIKDFFRERKWRKKMEEDRAAEAANPTVDNTSVPV